MDQKRASFAYFSRRLLLFASLLILLLGAVATLPATPPTAQAQAVGADSGCRLGNGIQHVIYIQFDNVHFTRDNPNVPSDLEQMPNLLNFMRDNGVLLTDQHTPLIAHTGDDIVTSLTGLYPDQQGLAVSNSYRYYKPDGTSSSASAFTYWTDPVSATDPNFNVIDAAGQNTPAPWVPYTRAGCNVGGVGTANIELENIGSDINTVYGPNSPQAQEATSNPDQANADFVGISVHCALGNSLCSTANHGVADVLPDEPGGYTGYQALFGNKYVAPQISPNGPVTDLDGNVIESDTGNIGFPGFDGMSASVSLAYVADMQEHGVPVTYAYISDAHDNNTTASPPTFGPGEAGYVAQLKAYNEAFGKFFARLAHDGITSKNTLFVVTADEGDHFVGSAPSPANCDGVTIPCTYSQVGEVDANLSGLLATEQGITTPFSVHSDSAPAIYINGDPARNNETVTRPFERALGKLTAVNPYTNVTQNITNYLADPVELNLLHMITADPARTPTVIQFANPDYFLYTGGTSCTTASPCISFDTGFAWNHGDVAPDINTTWLGMVGPDVKHLGIVNGIWSDHTDTRPTMMELLGLKDDYQHEGRVLFEIIQPWALPDAVRANENALIRLAEAYKQINAPVGELGLASLQISTAALESNTPNDATYTRLENLLGQITQARNTLASQMITILEAAEFGGASHASSQVNTLVVAHLVTQAYTLINQLLKTIGKE